MSAKQPDLESTAPGSTWLHLPLFTLTRGFPLLLLCSFENNFVYRPFYFGTLACIDVNALMVLRKIFNFLTQQQVLLTKTPLSIGHIYLSITSTVRGFFLRAAFRGPRLARTSAFWLLDTFSPRTSSLALQPPPMIQAMDRLAFQSTAIRIHSGHFWPGKT